LLVSGENVSPSVLESQYAAFASAGIVVIYSGEPLSTDIKGKLTTLAGNQLFDLSKHELPAEDGEAVRKIQSLIQPLRSNKN
jgi:hypothetical protein